MIHWGWLILAFALGIIVGGLILIGIISNAFGFIGEIIGAAHNVFKNR